MIATAAAGFKAWRPDAGMDATRGVNTLSTMADGDDDNTPGTPEKEHVTDELGRKHDFRVLGASRISGFLSSYNKYPKPLHPNTVGL